jgi:RNA polymerase sigma-70 factor, ECF subfamily
LKIRDGSPDERRRRFEEVALPFMEPLFQVARRLTGDADNAADAVQETYLRAFRTFDNFRPGTNARAWLFTVLYSVVINRRAKARREEGPFSVEQLEERYRLFVEATGDDVGDIEAWGARWPKQVEAALRNLPEVYRDAVVLVDVHELTYEQAAEVMSCPIGTVQSRVFRARRLLFAALLDYARDAGYVKPDKA